MKPPRVSVVTATFNRSNVLRLAIESLLASTFAEWELIVAGDACTDDSEEVVRAFGDARLRFVNLPVNSGEQATPNNEGARLARGEHLAFLNHDDLWTPDHLAICVEALREHDFVSTLAIAIDHHDVPHLTGVCPSGFYEPPVFVPASTWCMRRALFERVGPWLPARELHVAPSQEWLFRAHQQGHALRSLAQVTALVVFSGSRVNCYAERQSAEIAECARQLREDPTLIPRLLQSIAFRLTADAQSSAVARHLKRALKAALENLAVAGGQHPSSLRHAVKFRRKGGFLDLLRRTRGLPPLPRGGAS